MRRERQRRPSGPPADVIVSRVETCRGSRGGPLPHVRRVFTADCRESPSCDHRGGWVAKCKDAGKRSTASFVHSRKSHLAASFAMSVAGGGSCPGQEPCQERGASLQKRSARLCGRRFLDARTLSCIPTAPAVGAGYLCQGCAPATPPDTRRVLSSSPSTPPCRRVRRDCGRPDARPVREVPLPRGGEANPFIGWPGDLARVAARLAQRLIDPGVRSSLRGPSLTCSTL
jgi:hypothetical protein